MLSRSLSFSAPNVLLDQPGEQSTPAVCVSQRRTVPVSLLLLAPALLSILPVLIWGLPNGPDLASHLRFAQAFDESLRQGNLYPAWQHLSNAGYGDGSFRVYPPLLYYGLSTIKLFVGDWMWSFKLLIAAVTAAGSFSIFYWLRGLASREQAVAGAWIYCLAPFRVNELYQSAMLSQFAAAVFFLLLLGVIERLANEAAPRKTVLRLQALFGLAFAGLILTHVPVAMMAVLTLPLYASLRFEKKMRLRRLITLGTATALGLGLSAFYWLNLALELPLIKGATIQPGRRFDYRANFALSTANQDQNGWYVNLLFAATVFLIVPAVLWLPSLLKSRRVNRPILIALIVAIFTLLMATPLSDPLWRMIPKLSAMEFPWRWLSVSSIFASGLAGIILPLAWSELQKYRGSNQFLRSRQSFLVVVGAVVIAIAFSWAYPIRNALFTNQKSFTELRQQNRTSTGLEEWLPRWASLDVANRLANEAAAQVVIPSRTVSIQSWGPEMRQFRIGDGEQGIATIRTFFYPYWQIQTSEGQALRTGADEQGVLLAGIPSSPQLLTMRFVRPPHQIIANILSITGMTFLAVLALSGFLNKPAKESLLHIRLNPFAEGEIK